MALSYKTQTEKKNRKGSIVITTLVFTMVFTMLLTSLMGYILSVKKTRQGKEAQEHALSLAEAGLEYYKWHLAHFPNDLQDGTGAPGPYVHTVSDPEGGETGTFSLEITGNSVCGSVQSVDIVSTGRANEANHFARTLRGRYAKPSVAEFAYVLDSDVWAGADRVIVGPYHSNGGIRMDGTNLSTVTSEKATWNCTATFSCTPNQNKPGVFGSGTGSALWSYPTAHVDFTGMAVSFPALRTKARDYGLYLQNYSGSDTKRGYHLILRNDRTVDVYKVTDSQGIESLGTDQQWDIFNERIKNQTYMNRLTIPEECGLIYVNDRVWIEGTTKGKITVVAADANNPTNGTYDVFIPNNLGYTVYDGTDGLTLIGQRHVLLPLVVPDSLTIRGIFIAQAGAFGRRHYESAPSGFSSYIKRSTLTVHGTIVSKGREGSKWTSGGVYVSGFNNRQNTYDRRQAIVPPPLTPAISPDYTFIEWREE